ncbi:metalloregulator ArsR/SmtB family transcription factor [Candidatus Dojkabacteria bacterium]|nr:metalloregulator ArsR/SmtB family transcription factor [Candidatus Dojkabacteria bacterium]
MDNCCSTNSQNFAQIDKSINLLNAVSEPNRLRILCVLSKMDICVCELAEKLNVSHNLISHHLKVLYDASVLDKRRDGNQFFYFIKKVWKPRIKHLFDFVKIS